MSHEEFRESTERKAVSRGANALLDRTDRPFDFADVAVGRDKVEVCRMEEIAHAGKLHVRVDVHHGKTAAGVKLDDGRQLLLNGVGLAIGNRTDGPKHEVARNGVKKDVPLDVKKSMQRTTSL